MGILEAKNIGTKSEQAIAKEMAKPWYLKVESWLVIVNILALIVNIFITYWHPLSSTRIREQCLVEGELNPTAVSISDDSSRFKYIDDYYKNCLHRFGLEK